MVEIHRSTQVNETSDHAQVVINPFVIYGGLLVIAVLLQWLLPLPFFSPTLARIVGVIVFFLGLVVGLPAARAMRQARTTFSPYRSTSALVTSGSFRVTRNPIYVALTLNYTGLAIFFLTLWGLFLLPVAVWLTARYVIAPEEAYMRQRLGDEYERYTAQVRRRI
jgi:protein-S-isoprenylcysteine O-methyltransferase Ste14